jgi:chromosome segregation ATPase
MKSVLWVALAGAVLTGAGLWIDHRVTRIETDLGQTLVRLEDAGSSLRLLWSTTTKLDATRSEREDLLQDSLAFVRNFVETELNKMWSTAYGEHERRLNLTDDRIAANNRSIRQMIDASGRTNSRLDVLLSQNRALESDLRSVSETALALRQTLTRLTDQLGSLESQINSSRVVQAQMANRVGGVEQWIEEFRGQGLNAANVRGRLASIAADLRMVSMRIDSLTTMPRRLGTRPQ